MDKLVANYTPLDVSYTAIKLMNNHENMLGRLGIQNINSNTWFSIL